jgi:hypothetical protein
MPPIKSALNMRTNTKRALWLLAILLLLAVGGMAGVRFTAAKLQAEIIAALGPNSEVGAIRLHWNSVEIEQLRLKAAQGWPAEDEMRAARISVTPDLRSLLSDKIVISSIDIDGAYLSMLRTSDGRLRVLPGLLDKPKKLDAKPLPDVSIGNITLNDAAITLFDASIRKPPLAIRTEHILAHIDNVQLPALTGRTRFNVNGTLKGVHHDGTVSIKGWAEIATRNTETSTRLRGIDLVALQPYLIKSANTGIRQGKLDLDLDAKVKAKHLNAPGTVTLHNLELDPESGGFMGLPRRAAVSMMKDDKKAIVAHFELSGNIDDPAFSLNENIASRFGTALAGTLGVSVEGIARGASSIGSAIGGAAEGAGKALKGLFGK